MPSEGLPEIDIGERSLPQICLIFWLLSALPSAAQKATGGIQGTLTDSAGAVVVGAAITLVDEAGGQALHQQSDVAGLFRFPELKPASYTIGIVSPGFKETRIEHVVVLVSQITPLNISLHIGDTHEEVG